MPASNPHAPSAAAEPAEEAVGLPPGLHIRAGGSRRFTPAFRVWGLGWPPFLYLAVVVLPVSAVTFLVADTPLMPFALVLLAGTLPPMFVLMGALQRYPTIEGWFAAERDRQHARGLPSFVVGVKLVPPRVSRFLRAFEESDDVGLLTLEAGGLRFDGDALQLRVPWERVESAQRLPGDLMGHRAQLEFRPAFDALQGVGFQIREGWTVRHTRRRNRELADELIRRPVPPFAPAPAKLPVPDDGNPYRSPAG